MRYIRFMHTAFIGLLLIVDLFLQSVLKQLGVGTVYFIPQLHLIGLFLLAREIPLKEMVFRVVVISTILDFIHIDTFPIFHISYLLALIAVMYWYRHVGTSMIEYIVMVMLGLFVKETASFVLYRMVFGIHVSYMTYLSKTGLWVILGNLALVPLARYLLRKVNHNIISHTQKNYQ